jgi:hypothetical protein
MMQRQIWRRRHLFARGRHDFVFSCTVEAKDCAKAQQIEAH